MHSGPKIKSRYANNQPDDKGKVVSIMYLKNKEKEDVLLVSEISLQSLMPERRFAHGKVS